MKDNRKIIREGVCRKFRLLLPSLQPLAKSLAKRMNKNLLYLMKELEINTKHFLLLKDITKIESNKEVCALIFAVINSNNYTITDVIQIRNRKRGAFTFGISKSDFEYYYTKDLIGIYHSHCTSPLLSEKDNDIFIKHANIKIQLIGYFKKNIFKFVCYSNELDKLKIKII